MPRLLAADRVITQGTTLDGTTWMLWSAPCEMMTMAASILAMTFKNQSWILGPAQYCMAPLYRQRCPLSIGRSTSTTLRELVAAVARRPPASLIMRI
jgi:hypothetical protein